MQTEISTLGYALLGLLAREPLSGYDVAQRMKVPVGFFWRARHSQIYPELARLQRQGLVAHRVVEQHDRPAKKIYAITDAGRDALGEWLTAPTTMPWIRDELVLKAYSLWLADPQRAIALFREHQRLHAEQLATYEEIRARIEQEHGPELARLDSPAFATYLALHRGLGDERQSAAWCGWVADLLERGGLAAPERP